MKNFQNQSCKSCVLLYVQILSFNNLHLSERREKVGDTISRVLDERTA